MRTKRVCLALTSSLLLASLAAHAQSTRKPGLYEVTTIITFGDSTMPNGAQNPSGQQMPQMPSGDQMPQMPNGAKLPPGTQMPQMPQMPSGANPMGGPRKAQVCVTQAMIDKYGGPNPAPPRGDCQITDITMKPNGMKARISCSGQMDATGTVDSTWKPDGTIKSTAHITGTMQMGPNPRPIDITTQSTSVYKGPDCGSVQPAQMPAGK